jgi:hypothetical protein
VLPLTSYSPSMILTFPKLFSRIRLISLGCSSAAGALYEQARGPGGGSSALPDRYVTVCDFCEPS